MNRTNTQSTAQTGEVTFVRSFDAPRQLVFECMTTPSHLTHFWGPIGVTTPLENITLDLKPGGTFDTIMVNDSDGAEYPMHAVFVEIDSPNTLVWSEPDVEGGMTTSVTFRDLDGGRTEVTIHQTNVPEMYRTPEAQAGMQSSFDRFAAYVRSI
ncbi:MAG: hypothetical protein QOJ74_521 [Ilumatobacteraceae bacterium]|nr:hypothetical protein [Ilumatobacteraceae bacterium]